MANLSTILKRDTAGRITTEAIAPSAVIDYANKLKFPRKINTVSFDGSADITIPVSEASKTQILSLFGNGSGGTIPRTIVSATYTRSSGNLFVTVTTPSPHGFVAINGSLPYIYIQSLSDSTFRYWTPITSIVSPTQFNVYTSASTTTSGSLQYAFVPDASQTSGTLNGVKFFHRQHRLSGLIPVIMIIQIFR
jgi:hypothetical protein